MTQYYGDFAEDATVYIPFNTFTSDDPAASVTVTDLADADIKVHKDGSVTQIVTDGATIAIDFDGITGNHLITIDTSADAAYAVGSDYLVRLEGITVDAGSLNVWVGSFSIENRFNEVDVTKWLGTAAATPTVAGVPEVDITHVGGATTNVAALATNANAIKTKTDYLPSVTAGGNGGVFIAGTNAATTITTGLTTTFTGNLTGSVGSVTGAVGSVTGAVGSVTGAVGSVAGNVDGSTASVTAGVSLANGAITDASLAGNMEIVFETDFATNYNTTRNAWATNAQDFVGTTASDPFNGQVGGLTSLASGTAQAGSTSTTLVFAAASTFANDEMNGNIVKITSGTGAGQSRVITDYVLSTDTATVTPAWTTTPDNTSVYEVVEGSSNVTSWIQVAVTDALVGMTDITSDGSAINVTSGVVDTVTSAGLAAGAITDASLAGNMEIVFETDFATNYNATRNAWATNVQDFVGTSAADPFNAQVVAASVTGHTVQTGDTFALANGATGFAAIDTVVDSILVDTGQIGTAGAGLTNLGGSGNNWNTVVPDAAGVADAAMVTYGLDHLISSALPTNWATDVAAGSVFDNIADAGGPTGIYDRETDSLQAMRDAVALASVCTEARLAELDAANLPADVDSALADTNELQTDWANAGRLDTLLDTAAAGGGGGDATEAKQDSIIAAVITNAAGTDVAADIIAIKAETASIVADTNELQTDWADGGRLDLILDATYPVQATATDRVVGTTINAFTGETLSVTVTPVTTAGVAIDTSAMTLQVIVEGRTKTDSEVIADGAISKTSTTFTFTTAAGTNTIGEKKWACRRTDTNEVIAHGPYIVRYAATVDA